MTICAMRRVSYEEEDTLSSWIASFEMISLVQILTQLGVLRPRAQPRPHSSLCFESLPPPPPLPSGLERT